MIFTVSTTIHGNIRLTAFVVSNNYEPFKFLQRIFRKEFKGRNLFDKHSLFNITIVLF